MIVAPITTTLHGVPSEVPIGVGEGLEHPCALDLDHVQTIRRSRLVRRVGQVGPAKMREVGRALSIATGGDG